MSGSYAFPRCVLLRDLVLDEQDRTQADANPGRVVHLGRPLGMTWESSFPQRSALHLGLFAHYLVQHERTEQGAGEAEGDEHQ